MAKIEPLKAVRTRNPGWNLDSVLDDLRLSREVTHSIRHGGHVRELPSPQAMLDVIEGLCTALFPTHLGQAALSRENTDVFVSTILTTALTRLAEQVRRGLQFGVNGPEPADLLKVRAEEITQDFAQALPAVRASLVGDLKAAYLADPSAGSIAEILLCNRGATAIIYHRIAHALHRLGARLVARVIADLAHATTGIDIHPGAHIGERFLISHGTGLVIGETALVGSNVQLAQGVTLGALPLRNTSLTRPSGRRHPVIENDVIIHAGATVLGAITIGQGAVIGGNVWATEDVAAGTELLQASTKAQ